MATIAEILMAKDPKKLEELKRKGASLAAQDDSEIPDAPVALPGDAPKESAKPVQAQQPSAPNTDFELETVRKMQADADRDADNRVSWRRVEALSSQGARSPDQVQTSDIEAIRKRPLEMYAERLKARKQAAETALQAAQGRHLDAETMDIPLARQTANRAQQATAAHQRGQLAQEAENELGRGKRNTADIASREGIAEMEEAGRQSRYEPFALTTRINPMTGEMESVITNKHTGETHVVGGEGQFDESMRPVYEKYQANKLGMGKELTQAQEGQEELGKAREAVKANPESFDNRLATGAENLAGHVPLVGQMLAQQIGPYLRGEKGQAARLQALQAAAGRIHEIAGTRGFSASEQATMARLTPSANDTAEQVMQKLQAAEEVYARAQARIKAQLPVTVKHPPQGGGGAPKPGDTRVDPQTGKKQVWVP